jgi:hypothetical protein
MTGMDPGAGPSLAAYEQGQERLHGAIVGACEVGGGLSARLEAGLGAALSLLAREPDLAFLVSVWPEGAGEAALRRQGEWWTRYGRLLRDAAEGEGACAPPFLVEPMLLGGVGFLLSRHVRGHDPRHLEDLLPTIHWYLLSYYVSPTEAASTPRRRPHGEGGTTRRPVDARTAGAVRPA